MSVHIPVVEKITKANDQIARLNRELDEVERHAAELLPRADELARAEGELASDRAAFEREWSDDETLGVSRSAEVRGELVALNRALGHGRSELERLEGRLELLEQKVLDMVGRCDQMVEMAVEAVTEGDQGLAGQVIDLKAEIDHTYSEDGIYTVTVTVNDEDGGSHSDGRVASTVPNVPSFRSRR